jgi:hypothetical protein
VIKGCNIFWGQKLAHTCRFIGGCITVQQQISRQQNAAGWTHWMHFRKQSIIPL